jgi:hypothetical protein
MLKKVENTLKCIDLIRNKTSSRVNSTQRKRLSMPKIETSNFTLNHYRDAESPTIDPYPQNHSKILQEKSTNLTTLSTIQHNRSHTSDQKLPLTNNKVLVHRRTITKMHPLKSRLQYELD